jgi:hypothetical protein
MPETAAPIPAGSGLPKPAQMQQPPMGASPATGPTPNKGYEQAAMQKVAVVIKQLESALPLAGSGSDLGKAILDALNKLAKHVQPGSTSQAAQRNEIDQMAQKNMQASQMQKQLNSPQGGSQAPGGAPPPQAPGGMGMAA